MVNTTFVERSGLRRVSGLLGLQASLRQAGGTTEPPIVTVSPPTTGARTASSTPAAWLMRWAFQNNEMYGEVIHLANPWAAKPGPSFAGPL